MPPELDLSDARRTARQLLGMRFIHDSPQGATMGIIVETEAYMSDDPASHTFKGRTIRNATVFGPPGRLYVYISYGLHYCVNIVTGEVGQGQGVLLRALEPVGSLALIQERRGSMKETQLANGPGKLAQAMGITIAHDGSPVDGRIFRLEQGYAPDEIVAATRVGITKAADLPWRFYIRGNDYISRR